jgi:hypothetical protein
VTAKRDLLFGVFDLLRTYVATLRRARDRGARPQGRRSERGVFFAA